MAAPIVYEGAKGKYEGTLFNGIKFWVAQRVPTRSSILGKIKDNGGKIVLLEKLADVLIDDHARKSVAPRSVSWKYVVESVAKGELQNIEDYRIQHANVPRAVGSTKPARGTKVPYSKEDERILVTWVRLRERAADYTQGNKMYQDLAKLYPQHSWQSWRDKWVNKLSLLREEQLPPVLPELPPPSLRPPGVSEATPTPASLLPNNYTTPPAVKPSPNLHQKPGSVRGRVSFTKEDDKLLTEYVRQRVLAGEKPSGNKIFIELENENPHHSWHSWRDRWVRHLSRRPPEDDSHSSQPEVAPARPPPVSRPQPQAPPASSTSPCTVPTPKAGPTVEAQRSDRLKELDYRRKIAAATRLIQRVRRGYLARRSLSRGFEQITAFQARAQGFLTRHALGLTEISPAQDDTVFFAAEPRPAQVQAPAEDETAAPVPAHGRAVETRLLPGKKAPVLTREEFWRAFNSYNEVTGVIPSPWTQIGRRALDFWNLWRRAVEEPHHPSRDWEAISADLGFNWVQEPDVPLQVKAAYEKYLLEFEVALREFDLWHANEEGNLEEAEEDEDVSEREEADEDDEAGEGADDDDEMDGRGNDEGHEEGGAEKEPASQTSDGNFVSSPPLIGLKRARISSATSFPGSFSKRPRYDPSSEIPSTPEDSSTERSGKATVASSWPATIRETPTRRPRRSHPANQQVEFESQGPETTEEQDDDGEVFTPSHQLQSETDTVTPLQGMSGNIPEVPFPTNRPLPSVEQDDGGRSISSEEFEPVSAATVPQTRRTVHKPAIRDGHPSRRTLPPSRPTAKNTATNTISRPLPP